ncbi:hypothetical protein Tco_0996918 [Tanacetum coccineum]
MEHGFLSSGGRGVKQNKGGENNSDSCNNNGGDNAIDYAANVSTSYSRNETFSDPKSSGPISSGPTSYAKLIIGEPIRKSVNFQTLLATGGERG